MTPRISDHALVRFLERAGGQNVEQLRRQIATSLRRACRTAEAINQTEYTINADGLIYQVRNGVVTTIMRAGFGDDH